MPNADLIVSDPNVMMGKPVVRGTRITVELILEKLASGQTEEQILRAHSRLTHEAILARGCGLSSRARSFVKLVADESVEGPTVERLRRDGHDVLYIAELDPGIADPGCCPSRERRSRYC